MNLATESLINLVAKLKSVTKSFKKEKKIEHYFFYSSEKYVLSIILGLINKIIRSKYCSKFKTSTINYTMPCLKIKCIC